MILEKGSFIKVRPLEELKKISNKIVKNLGIYKNEMLFNFEMSNYRQIKINKNTTISDKEPIYYDGWWWFPWMLEIKKNLLNIE